jgi:hypothetical protein
MVLTALDLYDAGCQASYFGRPEASSVLYQHIWSRQFPFSTTTVPSDMVRERFWQALAVLLGPGDRAQNNVVYRKIKETLMSGQPVPIGLIGETGQLVNSHVVLGYGLNELSGRLQRRATIKIYDPSRGSASNSTLDILWDSRTDRMERLTLSGNATKWAELRLIAYRPRAPSKSCAMLEVEDTVSRFFRTVKEKNWEGMFKIVGTDPNVSVPRQRRIEIETQMTEMLRQQWSKTRLEGWQVLNTESVGDGRYKVECVMRISPVWSDRGFPFRLDLCFYREGDSWKVCGIEYKKSSK